MNPWCVCVLKVGLNIGHPNEPLVCVCVLKVGLNIGHPNEPLVCVCVESRAQHRSPE